MLSSLSRRASLHGQLVTSRTIRPGAALTLSLLLPTPHTRTLSWAIELVQVGVVSMYTMVPLLFSPGEASCPTKHILRTLLCKDDPWCPEGLATPSPADTHTLLDSTDTGCQHWMLSSSLVVYLYYSTHSSVFIFQ